MSPSPSPPPPAPTAATPGPRAAAFIQLYHSALSNTLRSISYETFSACFPSIAARAGPALSHMHSAFVARLSSFAIEEFEAILRERDVVRGLNRLEDVIGDARRRKRDAEEKGEKGGEEEIPPHMLPAERVRDAHLKQVLAAQQGQLNAKLQNAQILNEGLVEKLKEQRKEIEGLVGLLEGVVRDLEEGGGLLAAEGEGLAAGAREAEEELRDG